MRGGDKGSQWPAVAEWIACGERPNSASCPLSIAYCPLPLASLFLGPTNRDAPIQWCQFAFQLIPTIKDGSRMDAFRILGGSRLSGRLTVDGSKNASLPLMAAALLADEPVTLRRVP